MGSFFSSKIIAVSPTLATATETTLLGSSIKLKLFFITLAVVFQISCGS